MKTTTLRGLAVAGCLCLAPSVFAKGDNISKAVALGDNTYTITCEASNAFHRDIDKLKQEATDAANAYCADHGKVMKLISLDGKDPYFGLGYTWAKIKFKALDANDPELTAPVVAPGQAAPAAPVYAPAHLTTDELYEQLTKLDDLRKKGILTDEEFQEQKKKLLERAN